MQCSATRTLIRNHSPLSSQLHCTRQQWLSKIASVPGKRKRHFKYTSFPQRCGNAKQPRTIFLTRAYAFFACLVAASCRIKAYRSRQASSTLPNFSYACARRNKALAALRSDSTAEVASAMQLSRFDNFRWHAARLQNNVTYRKRSKRSKTSASAFSRWLSSWGSAPFKNRKSAAALTRSWRAASFFLSSRFGGKSEIASV